MEVVPPHLFMARSHPPPASSSNQGRYTYMSAGPAPPAAAAGSNHFSAYSQQSSVRSSDSTNATSASTLFNTPAPPLPSSTPNPPTAAPAGVTPFGANDSVLNKRGDKEASLFQICVNLRQRLSAFPGFEEALREEEADADEDADPVTIVWRFFRRGYPLMDMYNALNPHAPIHVDPTKVGEKKRGQAATYKFITGCVNSLGISECFMVNELFGDDTTGFVKVTRVVNQVLDMLVKEGILGPDAASSAPGEDGGGTTKRTKRQHIIEELVSTERTYVQHLEMLQAFKKAVEERGVVSGDAIHDIFHNLNSLLDFQRRFLIRVEQTNLLSEDEQNWGSLFVLYKDAFKVYEPYIANQRKCEETAMREFDKLKETGGGDELRQFIENPTVLSAFLLKPFQRLSKYPLLLKELRDKGDLDDFRKSEIDRGIEAATSVLLATNAAVDREERLEAVEELRERVEDWKGHRIESFGELLLHGTHQVVKGDSSNPKDQEREYKIYLFAMILLCCKEVKSAKEKNKMIGKPIVDKKGRPKLQLKGRIFMQNVTDTVASAKPGSYTCQIFWKGDPGIEYFTIKFTSEETMKKWCDQVNTQKRLWRENARASARPTTVQDMEFSYLKNQHLENPYLSKQLGDDDDDDDLDGSTIHSQYQSFNGYSMNRNDSNTSLRSRSTTGESGPPMMRVPPRQFPMGQQAPALQVRTGGPLSPGDPGDSSFFSPTTESPISTRSSGTTSMFFLPRQQMPPLPPWEDHRYTAPAMPRGHGQFQPQQRAQMQRPSLPLGGPLPATGGMSGQPMPSRLRSASSPDIANTSNGPGQSRYDPALVPPMPDLPPFPPSSYAYPPGMLSRSQSSSPAGGHAPPPMASVPVRASTQTPVAQLARLNLHAGGPPPGVLLAGVPSMGAVSLAGQPVVQPLPPQLHQQPEPLPRSMPTGTPPPDFAPGAPRSTVAGLVGPQAGSMDSILLPGTPSPPPAPASVAGTPRPTSGSGPLPTQLKVKVHCSAGGAGSSINSMTFVVPINISFQSLKDRIDVKLQRSSTSVQSTLSSGHVKLKYLDDDDFISIQSDEDVQMAFETWRESQKAQQVGGGIGEIELYIQ